MPVSYNIKADVVDLRNDRPKPNDVFFVDTNVWYWLLYSKASSFSNPRPPHKYQTSFYPEYVNKLAAVNARIIRCELILAEIAHIIEKTEFEIYKYERCEDDLKLKEFRHNCPKERSQVVQEIETVWESINAFSESRDITLGESDSNFILRSLGETCLDSYDALYLQWLFQIPEKSNIITDDGDFVTCPGVTVFTANKNVIDAAKKCGKLIHRDG